MLWRRTVELASTLRCHVRKQTETARQVGRSGGCQIQIVAKEKPVIRAKAARAGGIADLRLPIDGDG